MTTVRALFLGTLTAIMVMESAFGGGRQMKLPEPVMKGELSVEEALQRRRSIRSYGKGKLTLQQVSQLLWAAQGITNRRGFRTAPSAGATFPLEVYLVAGEVEGLQPALYHYNPHEHSLRLVKEGDLRKDLDRASLRQGMPREAQISIVIAADYSRTTRRYGKRGIRYVHIEVGHAGQNIYLEAESLGLATVAIGAFDDDAVKGLLGIEEEPLYIMPVGKKPSTVFRY